jgi:hypothetical protein
MPFGSLQTPFGDIQISFETIQKETGRIYFLIGGEEKLFGID